MQDVCTVKNPVIRCSSQVKSFITRMQCFSVCTTPLIARIHHIPFEAYQLLKAFNIKPILYIDAPPPYYLPYLKADSAATNIKYLHVHLPQVIGF